MSIMKNLCYFILAFLWYNAAYSFSGKSFMTYRSQGFNFARNNSGWLERCLENNVSVTVEYGKAFDACAIDNYFFGAQELIFSGSRRTDRRAQDILADYYGLPTDFKSSLRFSPEIKNVTVDFDFYRLLDCGDGKRFYLRMNAPVVRSTWALNPCETVIDPGVLDYPAGYMSKEIIKRYQLKNGALDVLSGAQKFGDLTLPLRYGRIARCAQSLTKLSDIFVEIGYLAVCKPCAELAVGVHVVAPTGTTPHAVTLFEPQIGNGHHWACGGSLTSRYDFVQSAVRNFIFSGHLDAYVQHLFKKMQKRSYDLIPNGPGSRYMLLMDMILPFSVNEGFSPTIFTDLIEQQYATRLLYVSDVTTLDSGIKINVAVDVVAKFSVTWCQWYAEVGYNLWARSAETLTGRDALQHDFYGIKGDAQLYGFIDIGPGVPSISLPLNATQSQATVHAPQPNGNTTNNFINSNADNASLIYNVGSPLAQTTLESLVNTGAISLAPVNGSDQAIVVTDSNINNCSGLSPRAFSQKLFGSLRYEWQTCCTNPYLVIGAHGEWAGKVDCVKTAISQWGFWVKGGVNF